MARQRSHSIEFKRQVARKSFSPGERSMSEWAAQIAAPGDRWAWNGLFIIADTAAQLADLRYEACWWSPALETSRAPPQ